MAVILVLLIGIAFGTFNGLILSLIRADLSATFLITLGTQLLGASIALTYTGGFQLYLDETIGEGFLNAARYELWSIPIIVILMIAFVIIAQTVPDTNGIRQKSLSGRREQGWGVSCGDSGESHQTFCIHYVWCMRGHIGNILSRSGRPEHHQSQDSAMNLTLRLQRLSAGMYLAAEKAA